MSKLLVIKNISREGPGLLAPILEASGISYDLRDLDNGDSFPDPTNYQALFVFGGPDSANDTTPKMMKELAQVTRALEAGMPCLGICLGLQVMVKAAGGKVVSGSVKEIGLLDQAGDPYVVELTDTGKADPLFAGLQSPLSVFQLHGEMVELTDTMTLLAEGRHCHNQVVRIADKAYGIQSHFELTPEMLAVWAKEDPDLQPLDTAELLQRFETIREAYTHTGETLLRNFLDIANLHE